MKMPKKSAKFGGGGRVLSSWGVRVDVYEELKLL